MNYDFSEHDRAVASSPERQQLDAALSALTTAQREDRQAREELMQAKAAPTHRTDSSHTKTLHRDRLAELQREADLRAHEVGVAQAEVDRLKCACLRQQIEGPRLDAHREITGNILGAARALLVAIDADQQFRGQLLEDRLPFAAPLKSLGPWSWEGGSIGWIDELRPVIEQWLARMGSPYETSKPPATSPKRAAPQPVRV